MRWLAALGMAVALWPTAVAQGQVAIVAVAPDTPHALRDALRIELQLAGVPARVVPLEGGAASLRELSFLASANVVGVLRRGGRTQIVSVIGGRLVEESVSGAVAPRAVAMLVSSLVMDAERVEPPVIVAAPAEAPVEPSPPPAPQRPTEPRAAAGSLLVPPALEGPRPREAPRPQTTVALVEPEAPLPPVLDRVGLEVIGAAIGGGLFALGGALVADALAMGDPFPWWAVGLTVAATLGSTAGALLVGRLTGADGDPFWTSVAGVGAGAAAGLLLLVGYVTDTRPDDGVTSGWTYLGAALAAVLPSALSILTFELTVPERQSPRLSLRVSPTGVEGRF